MGKRVIQIILQVVFELFRLLPLKTCHKTLYVDHVGSGVTDGGEASRPPGKVNAKTGPP